MITFNLCNLIKHFRDKISFDILPIKPNEEICLFYYKKNKKTLDELFGTDAISEATNAAFIFRNNDIAGLIAYVIPETGTARLIIDFVSQKYRDCATGRYFFNQDVSFWHSQGIERLEIYAPSAKHIGYLEKIGFKQGNDPATWEKTI
ncbi:MAG: hypothetical protein J6B81_04480 [Spirochaetaceae bacterium]|nr:hypothetical protein [Spirochaetaceae bacterium]